jgi:hypothetical protein
MSAPLIVGKEFLSIPYSFFLRSTTVSWFYNFVVRSVLRNKKKKSPLTVRGYISITKSTKGFITLNLTISLHIKDLSVLQYIQSVLGLGRINLYPKSGKQDTCKLIIHKTDLRRLLAANCR